MDTVPTFHSVGLKEVTPVSFGNRQKWSRGAGAWQRGGACMKTVCFQILGVVTFCRDSATPVAAEEGLTGYLSADRLDAVKCYGEWEEFSPEEVPVSYFF